MCLCLLCELQEETLVCLGEGGGGDGGGDGRGGGGGGGGSFRSCLSLWRSARCHTERCWGAGGSLNVDSLVLCCDSRGHYVDQNALLQFELQRWRAEQLASLFRSCSSLDDSWDFWVTRVTNHWFTVDDLMIDDSEDWSWNIIDYWTESKKWICSSLLTINSVKICFQLLFWTNWKSKTNFSLWRSSWWCRVTLFVTQWWHWFGK